MRRSFYLLSLLWVLSGTTGCLFNSMCADSYGNCDSRHTGRHCQTCEDNSRAGSVFSEGTIVSSEIVEEEMGGTVLRPVPDPLANGSKDYPSGNSQVFMGDSERVVNKSVVPQQSRSMRPIPPYRMARPGSFGAKPNSMFR